MTTTTDYPRTFQPLRIGGVELRNRVVRAAHFTSFASGGVVSDDLIDYHVERARGGVGLTIVEATAVDPSSMLGLQAFDDAAVEGMRRLFDANREHGTKTFVQLWHGGHHVPAPRGAPPYGVSAKVSPLSGVAPIPLTASDAARLAAAFGSAAGRLVAAGVDGIEINAAHGYLPGQFLSPLTNDRTDDYGGSLENRMRFLVDALRSVRENVAPGIPVGVRLSAGQAPGDLDETAIGDVARRLEHLGLIDFIDITMGGHYSRHWMAGGPDQPTGYQLQSASQITERTSVPVLVTGRFRTLDDVEDALASGVADLVSMVRAHIADPDIVAKTLSGQAGTIRPCIGCNLGCQARLSGLDARMGCVVNPAVGLERTLSEHLIVRTSRPRRVVVVGGGPAGLEAARAASLRGHEVTLLEAASQLGGRARVAAAAPTLGDIGDLVRWYEDEMVRLGIDVRLNTTADERTIAATDPDHVIDATGGRTDTGDTIVAALGEPIDGIEHAIVDTARLFEPGALEALGESAVVYDDVGHYEALAIVERMLARGIDVTLVTRLPAVAGALDAGNRVEPFLDRAAQHPGSLRIATRSRIVTIGPRTCVVRSRGSSHDDEIAADTTVIVRARVPSNAFAGHAGPVDTVGDARAFRDLRAAIREGHLAGRNIGE